MDEARRKTLRPLLTAGRAAFLIAALTFAAWGLRSQWPEILVALRDVELWQWLAAGLACLVGTAVTGVTWTVILSGYGHRPGPLQTLPIFFVGQLGKYIPGNVWSFAAQAQMASESGVPPRTTVATGLLFLLINVCSAVIVGCVGALAGAITGLVQAPMLLLLAVVAALCLTPFLLRAAAVALTGERSWSAGWRYSVAVWLLMLLTWLAYGAAVVTLLPPGAADRALLTATSAFAVAYVLGVVVVIAPAGLGIREVVMTALLAPAVGVGAAGAAALLSRVLLTFVDFLLAAGTWLVRRFAAASQVGISRHSRWPGLW